MSQTPNANISQQTQLELREYDSPEVDDEQEEKKEQTAVNSTAEESEMRGVHARTHIPPNTVCMSIPRRCLITVEMGQETPIGQAILRSDLDLDAPKHIFLMVFVLWDRKMNGSRSFFHPYYEILPQTLRNMPIFWTQEELDFLQGSYLLQQIQDRSDAITDDYHSICQIAPLHKICTLEEFKWARMCVCSRNFGLQIDGHRTSALVPHADMLNHYRPRETKWTYDEDRRAFTITSLQSIPAGAQVYDSYGQKCNHRFLLNYGFAVEDNRELDGFCPNEVPIELSLNPGDPLFNQKLDFWMRGELSMARSNASKRVRVCASNNENTRLLFSLLRVMNCNSEELRTISTPVAGDMRSLFVPDHRGGLSSFYRSCRDVRHPVSLRNERASMRHLRQIIALALSKYPTTLQQDLADLQDHAQYPPFSNKRHAKIQTRGEKEVLHHYERWARTALEVMNVIEQDVREEQERGGVEVQLGHGIVHDDVLRSSCGFDFLIQRMEDDESSIHDSIVRYCADVLGSLRREELKTIRQHRTVITSSNGIPKSNRGFF